MANATVGDRPQIEEDEDSDEERERLNDNGKQLRKALRKRGELDDIFGSEDEVSKQYKARDTLADNQDSDSDAESVKTEKSTEKKKEERPVPGSAERPSRPTSLPGVPGRRTSSPAHRRPHLPRTRHKLPRQEQALLCSLNELPLVLPLLGISAPLHRTRLQDVVNRRTMVLCEGAVQWLRVAEALSQLATTAPLRPETEALLQGVRG
jgi:hypothetical protein